MSFTQLAASLEQDSTEVVAESPSVDKEVAELKAKYDPYTVGHVYTFAQLLKDHQNEILRWYKKDDIERWGVRFMRVKIPLETMLKHHGPWPRYEKTKKVDRERIDKIIAAIKKGGIMRPALIDEDWDTLEGQHRIQALIHMGAKSIPAIKVIGTASVLGV